jgi:hypothetical protein
VIGCTKVTATCTLSGWLSDRGTVGGSMGMSALCEMQCQCSARYSTQSLAGSQQGVDVCFVMIQCISSESAQLKHALRCPAHAQCIYMTVPSPLTSDGGVVNTARNVTNADSVVGLGWTAMRLNALGRWTQAIQRRGTEQNRQERAIPSCYIAILYNLGC